MIVYRIKRADGLFSTGGAYPSFQKNGKVWRTKSALSNHVSQLGNPGRRAYLDCVVVESELVETDVGTYPALQLLEAADQRKSAREAVEARMRIEMARQRDLAALARLKAQCGEDA